MNFMKRRAWPGMLVLLCLVTGLIAPAPFPGIEGQVSAAAGPDLTIQSVIWSPQTPYIDNQVIFTVTVENQGDSSAAGSRINFYIDNDTIDYAYIPQIYAGSTSSYIFYWKAKAGAHIAKIVVDSEDTVIEADENNNEKSYAFSVLAPDLVVESLTWTPENPSSGETVIYSITVKNIGNKLATASKVGLFIDGRLWGNRDINALDIEKEAAVHYSIPATSGLHSIEVFADVLNQVKESDETNNTKTATCISAAPDLVIQTFTWTPANRVEGANITASVTIKNIGSGNAGYSTLALYIDDVYQASAFVESINAGATVTKKFSCAVNANGHILRAITDISSMVTESDESNNSMTVSVPAIAPDLIIQSITWSPAQPLIAHMTHFTITIKNQGARQSSDCDLDFYIADFTHYQSRVSLLAPGATCSVSFPWVTSATSVRVLAVIDEDNVIRESNESNNTAAANIGVAEPAPDTDLSIRSFTCTPSTPSPGEEVVITTIVKNQGPGAAGPSHIACYVDDDLLSFIYVGELASGATAEKSTKWTAVSGEHRIKTIIDCNNSVSETNELNNESTTYVITTAPDLIIEKIEWFPLSPAIGNDVLFKLTVKNQGNRRSGNCYITYYIDGSVQGIHYLENIEPGASVTRSFSWSMQSSSHTFLAAVDEVNAVLESNETNNEKSVVLPAPNLIISSIVCPEDYPVANTTMTFTIGILNAGGSIAGGTRAAGYIDDVLLAVAELGALNADGTAECVFNWTAVPGKHVLRITVDEADAVTESDESDNAKEVIIFVPLPSTLVDDVPQTGEEPDAGITPDTTPAPDEPSATDNQTVPSEILEELPGEFEEENEPDISGNLSSAPEETSDGIKGILMNKWVLIGVAVIGIAAIAALLVMRRRSGQSKAAKAAPPPKQTAAAPKPAAAPAKPGVAPAARPVAPAAKPAQATAPPQQPAPPPAQASPPPPPPQGNPPPQNL